MYSKTNEPAHLRVSGKTHPTKLGSAIASIERGTEYR